VIHIAIITVAAITDLKMIYVISQIFKRFRSCLGKIIQSKIYDDDGWQRKYAKEISVIIKITS